MCGIAAIVSRNARLAPRALVAMTQAQVHRGPDDQGHEYIQLTGDPHGPTLGLGQRRLSIIDLSPLGHQPMINPATGDVIIFNGEIYNYQTLRDRLIADGVTFRGHSDTEVLLHALSRYGEACIGELAGMYAFIFFHKASRRMLVARDPLGIKPLYVTSGPKGWAAASEVRAILASGLVSAEPDLRAFAGLMAYGAVQEPFSYFKGVRAFPPGCFQWLTLKDDGSVSEGKITTHWSYPEPDESMTSEDAHERLAFELDRAVKEHLIADVPVGVFLSSGIDSTIMAGLARRHSPNIRAFTVGFSDQPDLAESDMARETSRALGLEHRDIQVTGDMAEKTTLSWLDTIDQPSFDGLNTFIISKAVREAGVVVAISGLGGDELFAGYPAFEDVPRFYRITRMLHWVPPSMRSRLFGLLAMRRPASVRTKVREMGYAGADMYKLYMLRRRASNDARMHSLGLYAKELGLGPMFQDPAVVDDANRRAADPVAAVARMESQFCMGNIMLRDSDTNAMAHSLEIRVPMLDRRVIDLAYRIPGRIRMPGPTPRKEMLRTAFAEFLRPQLLQQSKRGFILPVRRWMMTSLRDLCESSIETVKRSGMLRAQAVDQMWTTFTRNPEHQGWSSAFLLCVLGHYMERSANFPKPLSEDPVAIDEPAAAPAPVPVPAPVPSAAPIPAPAPAAVAAAAMPAPLAVPVR